MEAAGCSQTVASMYQTIRRVKIRVRDYPEDEFPPFYQTTQRHAVDVAFQPEYRRTDLFPPTTIFIPWLYFSPNDFPLLSGTLASASPPTQHVAYTAQTQQEVPGSSLAPEPGYPDGGISWFAVVPPRKRRNSALN
jgi:hypothetical protein